MQKPEAKMDTQHIKQLIHELDDEWQLSDDQTTITRKIKTKNFSESMSITQAVATLAETENHHPTICLGWGFCHISFTTHASNSLTELDFHCAKGVDLLVKTGSEQ